MRCGAQKSLYMIMLSSSRVYHHHPRILWNCPNDIVTFFHSKICFSYARFVYTSRNVVRRLHCDLSAGATRCFHAKLTHMGHWTAHSSHLLNILAFCMVYGMRYDVVMRRSIVLAYFSAEIKWAERNFLYWHSAVSKYWIFWIFFLPWIF